jgi:hypothetical protein
MAKETFVRMTDDIDGTEATTTIIFGMEGRQYEIDLNEKNEAALKKALAKYIGAARMIGKMPKPPTNGHARAGGTTPARASREQLQAIREWARKNGLEVSDRGRIPASVVEAFEAAV